MKKNSLLVMSLAAIVLCAQFDDVQARGSGHGGGHGGGHRGGGHRGGGHAAHRGGGHAGRGGHAAGRHDGRGGRGRHDGRGGRGYGRGGYGYGGWGNGWGWGFWGGALLWTAPLWWQPGMYAPYSGTGNRVYVTVDETSNDRKEIAAWNISNNTSAPIQITSGKFTIEIPAGQTQYVPQTSNYSFSVFSETFNQRRNFRTQAADIAINEANGQLTLEKLN